MISGETYLISSYRRWMREWVKNLFMVINSPDRTMNTFSLRSDFVYPTYTSLHSSLHCLYLIMSDITTMMLIMFNSVSNPLTENNKTTLTQIHGSTQESLFFRSGLSPSKPEGQGIVFEDNNNPCKVNDHYHLWQHPESNRSTNIDCWVCRVDVPW